MNGGAQKVSFGGKKMMKADEEEAIEKITQNLVIYGCWCKKWIQIFMIYLSLMSKVFCFYFETPFVGCNWLNYASFIFYDTIFHYGDLLASLTA